MADDTTTRPHAISSPAAPRQEEEHAFVIGWCRSRPERVGELAPFSSKDELAVLGRGGPRDSDLGHRLAFGPWRAGAERYPLEGHSLSRTALHVFRRGRDLAIQHVRGVPCRVNGRVFRKARLEVGDRIVLGDELLLVLVKRTPEPPRVTYPMFPFAAPDPFGWVGESPVVWELRRDVSFSAARSEHALVHGATGVGKTIAARALHGLSRRAEKPLMQRSAATLAPEWTALELFGAAGGFPSRGDEPRIGMIERAEGGTLVLDDLDCASDALEAQLLSLLDRAGYHRLGDPNERRADVRIVAVTQRPDSLRRDLRARFMLDIGVPAVVAEDVPLLVRHLLKQHLADASSEEERFFLDGEPQVHPELVARLMDHAFTEGVREIARLVLHAMATSRGHEIVLTESVERRLTTAAPEVPGREDVQEALDRNQGNVSRAWRDLGLTSRHVLNRLMKRYGLKPRRADDAE